MNITPVFDPTIITAVRNATAGIEATSAEIIEQTDNFWFCLPPVDAQQDNGNGVTEDNGNGVTGGDAFLVVLDDNWYFLVETQSTSIVPGEKPQITSHVWLLSRSEPGGESS